MNSVNILEQQRMYFAYHFPILSEKATHLLAEILFHRFCVDSGSISTTKSVDIIQPLSHFSSSLLSPLPSSLCWGVSNAFPFFIHLYFKPSFIKRNSIDSTLLLSLLLILLLLLYSLRGIHTSVKWWSFTGIWLAAILFGSAGLFSLFNPISCSR